MGSPQKIRKVLDGAMAHRREELSKEDVARLAYFSYKAMFEAQAAPLTMKRMAPDRGSKNVVNSQLSLDGIGLSQFNELRMSNEKIDLDDLASLFNLDRQRHFIERFFTPPEIKCISSMTKRNSVTLTSFSMLAQASDEEDKPHHGMSNSSAGSGSAATASKSLSHDGVDQPTKQSSVDYLSVLERLGRLETAKFAADAALLKRVGDLEVRITTLQDELAAVAPESQIQLDSGDKRANDAGHPANARNYTGAANTGAADSMTSIGMDISSLTTSESNHAELGDLLETRLRNIANEISSEMLSDRFVKELRAVNVIVHSHSEALSRLRETLAKLEKHNYRRIPAPAGHAMESQARRSETHRAPETMGPLCETVREHQVLYTEQPKREFAVFPRQDSHDTLESWDWDLPTESG